MATHQVTLEEIRKKASIWTLEPFDEETRKQVQEMLTNENDELTESFYKDLEFGTGGLRGIMGPGTNRVNKYTIGMVSQGLANYIKKNFTDRKQVSVAIAYDSRNNSKYFADTAAKVFSSSGIKVYIFKSLRPTPELSFAIRELGCQSGIVITASHNPKEYNGYKVYWNDGAQVISPHDTAIIDEVSKIKGIETVEQLNEHMKTVKLSSTEQAQQLTTMTTERDKLQGEYDTEVATRTKMESETKLSNEMGLIKGLHINKYDLEDPDAVEFLHSKLSKQVTDEIPFEQVVTAYQEANTVEQKTHHVDPRFTHKKIVGQNESNDGYAIYQRLKKEGKL